MAKAQTLRLTVETAPHWHCGRTVQGVYLNYLLALAPAALMAVYHFGIPALRVMALAMAFAVLVEAACLKLMDRDIRVDDYSAVVTGLMLAFLLPAAAPWWLVLVGVFISVAIGKMAFGGLGANPLCAPLVGWAALTLSWPSRMDVDATMLHIDMVNPTTAWKFFGNDALSDISMTQMLVGEQLSYLGSAQVAALLLGAAWLLYKGYVKWYVPAGFLGGVLALSLVYSGLDPQAAPPLFHLLAGSTVFGAFFLAPDHSPSPVGKTAMLLFGALGGAMVVIIRTYGVYADGVPFAVLLANLCMPLLDLIRPKAFGAK